MIQGFFVAALLVGALNAQEFDRSRPLGSIGFYSSGCLDSEERLQGTEAGLLKLFVERDRGYGNPVMIELLSSLGLAYQQDWQIGGTPSSDYERIQIGDVAQKGGGFLSRHASHQTGLDVDIVYLRKDHRETRPDRGADASFDESFVKKGVVSANFDAERMWWMFRWLNQTKRVDRIFLDPALKAQLCASADKLEARDKAERIEILRQLRPYAGHDDHFHLRLKCPAGDTKCVSSPALPPGSGCNEAAGLAAPAPTPAPSSNHELPAECANLVHRLW